MITLTTAQRIDAVLFLKKLAFLIYGNRTIMHPIIMHSKRRKIYYVPGMISLIILPFMFLHFIPNPSSETVLRLFVPSDEIQKDDLILKFTTAHVKSEIKNKKKLNIDLDDNHILNKQKLILIQTDAQRLDYYNDAATVIVVRFSPEVNYNEFVALLNALYKSQIKRYAWVDDSMIIMGSPKY